MIKYIKILLIVTSLLWAFQLFGQRSVGGIPMVPERQIAGILSAQKIVLPAFVPIIEKSATTAEHEFKSLKFAHAIDVSITPENSGHWFKKDGYRVWQVHIESAGAFSINLVFEKFQLPKGARLFVFSPDKQFVLGAYTYQNNLPHQRFGVYPIPGDEVLVQYEVPENVFHEAELEIGKVAHAFKDVFAEMNRWKRRSSGFCNENVNCELNSGLDLEKRSTIRIFAVDELGTGTLLNNTMNNGKPYVVSALHVYDDAAGAETAVFDFNYESPFCTDLEGYDLQTIAGAKAVALFDSLDLMLVELSEVPPASFRPYWSGWDARKNLPAQTWCIHHPNGDTKKISYDKDQCDSTRYSASYAPFGSWKVHNWEMGTTEFGSSGAGLFLGNGRLVGVLQGGAASCTNISYDLFTRFDKLFNYRKETDKQLKHWLDPGNTGILVCNGLDWYEQHGDNCTMISNFTVDDNHVVLSVDGKLGQTSNWLTGNNQVGISEIAEGFSIESGTLSGVAVGIGALKYLNNRSELIVRVYAGNELPNDAIRQFRFSMRDLLPNAMNYLAFPQTVELSGNFFVGFVIPTENDTLSFFHSDARSNPQANTMFLYQNGLWTKPEKLIQEAGNNFSLLVQANLCEAVLPQKSDTLNEVDPLVKAYPVPAFDEFTVEFRSRLPKVKISVYDFVGRKTFERTYENNRFALIETGLFSPGIYILVAESETERHVQQIIIGKR